MDFPREAANGQGKAAVSKADTLMLRGKKKKPMTRMTADELADATAEFDCEFVSDEFAPPDSDAVSKWNRAKRKPGRPRQGQGAKVISVSLEKELLARADRLAKRKKVSRASLIARGLRAVLKAEATER